MPILLYMEQNNNKGIFSRIWNWFKNLSIRGLLRALFVLFLIIIIILLLPWIGKAVKKVSTSLSAALYSVFVPAEDATLQIDKKIINSGEEFNINFKRGDSEANSLFSVIYDCDPAVELYSVESKHLKNIECNKPYYLLENPTSIKIKAVANNNDIVRLAITGTIENNETQKTETVGVARVTITNPSTKTTTTPPKTNTSGPSVNLVPNYSNTTQTTYLTPDFYGKPDLAVRILQVGTLNINNNQIISKNSFAYGETVGIRFEVRNDGTNPTGAWNFTALLPSLSNPNYISPTQRSLNPGDSVQFTLGFNNNTNQSTGAIRINVDMGNIVSESNESNNNTSFSISNYGYNNYNYINNYSSGCYVNGYYTTNCSNYNYNYNNNYGYSNLSVICSADNNFPETDERVRWYANAYGGSGNYDYDWTGTNNLDSNSQNPTKTYSSEGTKYATVTVRDSNGNRASQTCSVVVDDNNSNSWGSDDVDLEVEILAVGRLNSSGDFIEDSSIDEGDDAAVKFRVENIGDEDSDDFDIEITLETDDDEDTVHRNNENGLDSDDSRTYIVSFNNVQGNGEAEFRVEVDPNDDINDDDRGNNDDSDTIDID